MIDSVSSSSPAFFNDAPEAKPAEDKGAVNKETFMQLLVAQIKNQNPLNPADGVQFLTQLAQFSELEQMMGIRSEVAALREQMTPEKPADAAEDKASGAENV